MRIQEMKSGFLHLKRRVENERFEKLFETDAELDSADEPKTENILPAVTDCELDCPTWAVLSFAQLEAGGLTYRQAAALISDLDSHGVTGLCIVTDKAASRLPR